MSRRALRTNAGAPVIASRKALDHGPHGLRHRLLRGPPRRSTGDPGEVEQVVTFGLIELKGVRYGVEHGVRHPAEVAPLQAGVVLAADAGQHRDLTTAQPGHPALAALKGNSRLLGSDLRPTRGKEFANLVPVLHTGDGSRPSGPMGAPASTPRQYPVIGEQLGRYRRKRTEKAEQWSG